MKIKAEERGFSRYPARKSLVLTEIRFNGDQFRAIAATITIVRMVVRTLKNGICVVGAMMLANSGCFPKKLLSPRYTIAVNVTPDCNANSPIAFDVVEINDKDLAKLVAQMTAADWFQKRDQIGRDYPKSQSVSIRKWEWVPGQVVPDIEIPMRKAPRALLAFANYGAAGPHRAKLDPKKPALITLARDDLELQPLPKK